MPSTASSCRSPCRSNRRQVYDEPAPTVDIVHRHLAVVRLHQAADDGQAEAAASLAVVGRPGGGSGGTGGLAAERDVEDAGQIRLGDAAARVGDGEPSPGSI